MEPSSALGYKINTDWEGRSDNVDVSNINSNMPHHIRSSTERSRKKGKLINSTKNSQLI